MNLRRTALLALAVVLVGGFYWWYEVQGVKRRQAAEERLSRLLKVEPGEVSAVELRRAGLTWRAARRDGRWRLVSPVEAPADQKALDGLIQEASRAKKLKEIAGSPSDLGAFGLKEPRMVVTLEAGGALHRLELGSDSPTGQGVYARAGEAHPVVLADRAVERAADKELVEFRDRSLFEATLEEVSGFRIEKGGKALAVERTGDKAWRMKEPLEAAADRVAVEDALRALLAGQVGEFIDTPKGDPAAYGLGSPRAAVNLSRADGLKLEPLFIGKAEEAGGKKPTGRLYARRGKAGPVLVVEEKLLKELPEGATALRERSLFAYGLSDVERLEAALAGERVVVVRRGDRDWAMTSPIEATADEQAVRSLLWDLKDLKADKFLEGADPAGKSFGLGEDALRYSVFLKGSQEPLTLEVGGKAEKGSSRYALASGQRGPVTVAEEALGKLKAASLELRDRDLLPFKTEDVRRIELERPGGVRFKLFKDGTEWRLEAPERRELKTGQATSLLWSLKRLRFSGVVEEVRSGEPPSGEILLEARLWSSSGEPEQLTVLKASGTEGAEEPLAFGSAKPGLYRLAPKDLGDVERELDKLLGGS